MIIIMTEVLGTFLIQSHAIADEYSVRMKCKNEKKTKNEKKQGLECDKRKQWF